MSNNPWANIASQQLGNPLTSGGIGGAQSSLTSLGQLGSHTHGVERERADSSHFYVEKIANGFVVTLHRSFLVPDERHFAEDHKAVGDLITATLVRWFIEGK